MNSQILFNKINNKKKMVSFILLVKIIFRQQEVWPQAVLDTPLFYYVFKISLKYFIKLKIKNIDELTRMGSGSACRSLYGGLVEWTLPLKVEINQIEKYDKKDLSSKSVGKHIMDIENLYVLLLCANDA